MTAEHVTFSQALRAVDEGDVDALRALLAEHPDLAAARSTSIAPPYDGYFHGATLLHHVAGNPIRGALPDNVVQVAEALLSAGADPEAVCGGGPSQPDTAHGTVLGLVTSGAQAHLQGHTEGLIDALLAHGARLDPGGGMFGSLYHTVEHQGQRDVAVMLYERGVRADLPTAAGLGRLDLVQAFFDEGGAMRPDSDEIWRRTVRGGKGATHAEVLSDSLLCASVNGRNEVVGWLLDRGTEIDALRRWGPFPVTALHGAGWAGWADTVTLLLTRGADATLREPTHGGTPREWAGHARRAEALAAFDQAGVLE